MAAKKMSIWGIGPSVAAPSGVCGLAAGAATGRWPEGVAIRWVPYPALLATGLTLLVVGISLHMIAGRSLAKAHAQDRLVTTGVYAICRNPLYANIIFTIAPGVALVCGSWLMLTASVVMYVLVQMRVAREEKYLEERFGREYLDYRARTGSIFPRFCRR